jgi:hypothetical protein
LFLILLTPFLSFLHSVDKIEELANQSEIASERAEPSPQATTASLIRPSREVSPQDARPYKVGEGSAQLQSGKTPGIMQTSGYDSQRYPATESKYTPGKNVDFSSYSGGSVNFLFANPPTSTPQKKLSLNPLTSKYEKIDPTHHLKIGYDFGSLVSKTHFPMLFK